MLPGLVGIGGFTLGAPAGGSFLLGDSSTDNSRHTHTGGFWEGWIVQAVGNGTITKMFIRGDTLTSSSVDYRLVIYNAAGAADTAGSKLCETAVVNGLLQDEIKEIALLVPAAIVSGNYYALGIHKQGTMTTRRRAGTGGKAFSDTWADGALATAPTGFNNGGALSIWASD